MQVTLDFKAGDTVICLLDNHFSYQTITGNAFICVRADGTISAEYEVDLPDSALSYMKTKVPADQCFRTIEEAMTATGLSGLNKGLEATA